MNGEDWARYQLIARATYLRCATVSVGRVSDLSTASPPVALRRVAKREVAGGERKESVATEARSGSYEINFRAHAERTEHLTTVFPRQPEGFDVGQSESTNHVGEGFFLARREIRLEHGLLRPVDQTLQTGVAMEIVAQFVGHSVASHSHILQLSFPVATINREFFVNLLQSTGFIEYFLPKPKRIFV